MKITKLATTIMTVAIVAIALNPANAEISNRNGPAKTGFSCPSPLKGTTGRQRAAIRALLPSGDAMNDPGQLTASIRGLKRLGLSKTSVADHLIGAYCTSVAHNSYLSDTEKSEDVRQFASQITPQVYSDDDVSAIILSVPLKPAVVDEVTTKAQASGLSIAQWLSKTIEAAAQKP